MEEYKLINLTIVVENDKELITNENELDVEFNCNGFEVEFDGKKPLKD